MRKVRRVSHHDRPHQADTPDPRVTKVFQQWAVLKARKAALEDRIGELRQELLTYAEQHGMADDRGHHHVDLPHPVTVPGGTTYTGWSRVRKVSRTLSEERVRKLAEERGLTNRLFKEVVTTVLDQDELFACQQEDLITPEELDALFDVVVVYSLTGKK